nr:DUF1152 domain-containing protein [Streptomyces sp. LaPpAH-108]
MTRLTVTAGGKGDAVAAAMLGTALYGDVDPLVIFAYAWDRLLVDPLPGPRGACDFTGLVASRRLFSVVPPGHALSLLRAPRSHA